MTTASRDRTDALWILAAPPLIWAAHLLVSYVTAAITCARAPAPDAPLTAARWAIAVYTGVALVGIVAFGWLGWRLHRQGGAGVPHDDDSPASRSRFLGFATFLLSGLSAVAVMLLAMSVAIAGTCR